MHCLLTFVWRSYPALKLLVAINWWVSASQCTVGAKIVHTVFKICLWYAKNTFELTILLPHFRLYFHPTYNAIHISYNLLLGWIKIQLCSFSLLVFFLRLFIVIAFFRRCARFLFSSCFLWLFSFFACLSSLLFSSLRSLPFLSLCSLAFSRHYLASLSSCYFLSLFSLLSPCRSCYFFIVVVLVTYFCCDFLVTFIFRCCSHCLTSLLLFTLIVTLSTKHLTPKSGFTCSEKVRKSQEAMSTPPFLQLFTK